MRAGLDGQNAASLGFALIDTDGEEGLLIDQAVEPMRICSFAADAGKRELT
jgi:hypothetical protein